MNKAIGILSVIASVVVVLCIITWNQNKAMDMNISKTNSSMNTIESSDTTANDVSQSDQAVQTYATIQPKDNQPVKEFNLVAIETKTEIAEGIYVSTWTFGGTVPGTEIRVTEGDFVKINVMNYLDEPITIHWHGYPVTSDMDGIPGLTQDAILPRQTYTYVFSADTTGTYWYHSHQESAKQVDKGLYGALIVEPKEKTEVDKDYTLILDEWMENGEEDMSEMADSADMSEMADSTDMSEMADSTDMSEMADSADMSGMTDNTDMSDNTDVSDSTDMSGMSDNTNMSVMESDTSESESTTLKGRDLELQEEQMMKELYNIYTVNGKSGDLIQSLEVKQGDVVRLRFINAGYRSHGIHIPGQIIKVVSTDGQYITGAENIKGEIITITPGERYDIEFKVNSTDDFNIDFHDNNLYNDQIKIPVKVIDGSGYLEEEDMDSELSDFDLLYYGTYSKGDFSLIQNYDVEQDIDLNTDSSDGNLKYTINGKTFRELQPIKVKTGDNVKIIFTNNSRVDHPMHLHGHFFQVLSKDDEEYSGAPIIKDTLLIKPGEKYVIAFKADNQGNWIYHCHELHHAAAGMMQEVIYTDYKSSYKPDPNNKNNKPE